MEAKLNGAFERAGVDEAFEAFLLLFRNFIFKNPGVTVTSACFNGVTSGLKKRVSRHVTSLFLEEKKKKKAW